ncbi:hypothetical protein HYQ09_gp155 [Acinetobacter phage vB_AbaM_Konradin]|uniref:Uncharacterized protein n=10 Tax=Lazarusvirus TaxID=2842820 RepID=A0A4Y1NMF6_9CAUD|nr:hypothetical protein HYP67_gp157 [Acinetobacter phage vB_ApiM_fHyAci03]YP_009881464.1 hypothetical protein HYP70_gp044 [Acinetobacter phage KARL-1]YP_009885419.1 hypothetical protein HYQ09_gp155 [Acinetobacter phage vB_AbaM_Konradin]YP_009886264.1 hypothetical protein HYQ20_gp157 [Acinetobacter phage vB_AbaM_Berthold]YP_009886508.1 hypothetical protein HYQ21_gp152 [Acinetobacter phage vB_AbaM_Apostate]YP_009886759.1 hypothetical protein HYQ22_gp158 [Acinetobacter phage vB_AbaM_Kimel]YP_009
MKKFVKKLFYGFAWWVLEDELKRAWIHRAYFNEYTQWMSRDFPIMEDMYQHFKDAPYGRAPDVCRHRQEMEMKHKV